MEPIGALRRDVLDANPLKDMVGPCGLEPQTSTVSTRGLPKYAEVAQDNIHCGLDCELEINKEFHKVWIMKLSQFRGSLHVVHSS
jgi:hypothetical protein